MNSIRQKSARLIALVAVAQYAPPNLPLWLDTTLSGASKAAKMAALPYAYRVAQRAMQRDAMLAFTLPLEPSRDAPLVLHALQRALTVNVLPRDQVRAAAFILDQYRNHVANNIQEHNAIRRAATALIETSTEQILDAYLELQIGAFNRRYGHFNPKHLLSWVPNEVYQRWARARLADIAYHYGLSSAEAVAQLACKHEPGFLETLTGADNHLWRQATQQTLGVISHLEDNDTGIWREMQHLTDHDRRASPRFQLAQRLYNELIDCPQCKEIEALRIAVLLHALSEPSFDTGTRDDDRLETLLKTYTILEPNLRLRLALGLAPLVSIPDVRRLAGEIYHDDRLAVRLAHAATPHTALLARLHDLMIVYAHHARVLKGRRDEGVRRLLGYMTVSDSTGTICADGRRKLEDSLRAQQLFAAHLQDMELRSALLHKADLLMRAYAASEHLVKQTAEYVERTFGQWLEDSPDNSSYYALSRIIDLPHFARETCELIHNALFHNTSLSGVLQELASSASTAS